MPRVTPPNYLDVPSAFPTIAQAVAAAVQGDIIRIDATYPGDETVTVTVDQLAFEAPANVKGIVLNAAPGVSMISMNGGSGASVTINGHDGGVALGGAMATTRSTAALAMTTFSGGSGMDVLQGGAGDDVIYGDNDGDTASYANATSGVQVSLADTNPQNTSAQVWTSSGASPT